MLPSFLAEAVRHGIRWNKFIFNSIESKSWSNLGAAESVQLTFALECEIQL